MQNNIIIKNNWDKDRKQVVIVIYSNYLNDNINRDGEIDYISSLKDKTQFYHSLYYLKHAEKNYTSDKEYQLIVSKAMRNYTHLVPLFYNNSKFNNIVFDHVDSDNINKNYGVLSLPSNEPTEKQYESLSKLSQELNTINYDKILIQGKMYINNNGTLSAAIDLIIDGKDIIYLPEIVKKEYAKFKKERK